MLLYEVNVQVDAALAAAYRDWLEQHVSEMLTFDGFVRASIFEAAPEEGFERFVVHYYVARQADLDRYLAEDAPRMRADGTRRFGDRMQATRRVLHLHRSFGA